MSTADDAVSCVGVALLGADDGVAPLRILGPAFRRSVYDGVDWLVIAGSGGIAGSASGEAIDERIPLVTTAARRPVRLHRRALGIAS